MSERIGRLYRITDAGVKALRARNSVPAWYRSVLIQITNGKKRSAVKSRGRPPRRVLEEMETLGFIEAATAGSYFLTKYGPYREALPELRTIIDKLEAISP